MSHQILGEIASNESSIEMPIVQIEKYCITTPKNTEITKTVSHIN